MDSSGGASSPQKLEIDEKPEKRDTKPVVKTLNRVPRKLSHPSLSDLDWQYSHFHRVIRSLCQLIYILYTA